MTGHRGLLSTSDVVRLDGGLATELQRLGHAVRSPWWTSGALRTPAGRRAVAEIHARYRRAGAQVLTANTFRAGLRVLHRAGSDQAGAAELVQTAVALARAAAGAGAGAGVAVAGSIAPVEDCYQPSRVPPDRELRAEHGWLARQLVAAGVDLLVVETVNMVREARVALEQALGAGAPTWVSFVCTDGARLLSGEPVGVAARVAERDGAAAVLVNCTTPAATGEALREIRDACEGPVGAYPNVEDRTRLPAWTHVDRALPPALDPAGFAELALTWRDELGAGVLGGCCGTTPQHIAALRAALG